MDNKLFEVQPEKRNVVLYLETYKGNRIAIKLMKLIGEGDIFFTSPVNGVSENRIFEVSIFSDKHFEEIMATLKHELVNLMETNFPENYLFDFTESRLGFINSFSIFDSSGTHFQVCHKIKENRTNGGTNIPVKKITT